jgi:predicted negative regulator of RcsB-dependent stress response
VDPYEHADETERLKKWWKSYGPALILGIALGSAALGGLKYWQYHKAKQADAASQLYEQLTQSFQRRALASVDEAGNKLVQDYASTPYAGKAALVMAKMHFDNSDIQGARQHLQWAMDKAAETATRQIARLRLARLMLDQGELDPALELVKPADPAGFEAEYQELKGDILLAKGRTDDARRAYRAALDQLAKESPYQRVLSMKLDDIGPEKNP